MKYYGSNKHARHIVLAVLPLSQNLILQLSVSRYCCTSKQWHRPQSLSADSHCLCQSIFHGPCVCRLSRSGDIQKMAKYHSHIYNADDTFKITAPGAKVAGNLLSHDVLGPSAPEKRKLTAGVPAEYGRGVDALSNGLAGNCLNNTGRTCTCRTI